MQRGDIRKVGVSSGTNKPARGVSDCYSRGQQKRIALIVVVSISWSPQIKTSPGRFSFTVGSDGTKCANNNASIILLTPVGAVFDS